jgi:hypothetical protein
MQPIIFLMVIIFWLSYQIFFSFGLGRVCHDMHGEELRCQRHVCRVRELSVIVGLSVFIKEVILYLCRIVPGLRRSRPGWC